MLASATDRESAPSTLPVDARRADEACMNDRGADEGRGEQPREQVHTGRMTGEARCCSSKGGTPLSPQ